MKHPEGTPNNRVVYEEPTSLTHAETRRVQLVEEVTDISTQLSDKNKQDRCAPCQGDGCNACNNRGWVRWSNERYHTWRKNAITALRARENVLRRLNTWIAQHQTPAQAAAASPDELLQKAYQVLQGLRDDLDGDLDPEEVSVIESLREYLQAKKVLLPVGT